jgi:predicted RNA binding protein YcfA (HicA-like mRNA interferase family)
MKLPHDLSGPLLIRQFAKLGYAVTRQAGSHVLLATQERGEHHITIPTQDPLRIGILAAILAAVAAHQGFSRDERLNRLLG